MAGRLSFRTTLATTFGILLLLALLFPSWFYYRNISRAVSEEAEKNALRELHLAHWLFTQERGFEDAEQFQGWITALAKQLDVRITYVAQDGRVLADSSFAFSDLGDMENFSSRPEIIQAHTEGAAILVRYNRILQKEFIYAAKKVEGVGWIPPGYLRLALQFSSIDSVLTRLKETFFLLVVSIFAIAGFLCFRLVRRLRSPLHVLVNAVQAIGSRNYTRKIRFDPSQELYPLAQSINQMAEDIDKQIYGISAEKQRLEAVFDGMQEGVMVLDSNGMIQSINRALAEMVGYPANPVGKRPMEIIVSLDLQAACDRILSSRGSSPATPDRLEIEVGEGRIHNVTMVRAENVRRGMGAILVFHDISELKRLERVRQDFVANVSHELRTPLTSIKGYAEALLTTEEPDPETLSSFLTIIQKNTNHMVKMVDNLLNLAHLETGRMPIKMTTVNPIEALMAAWRACASLAEAKSLSLSSGLPEGGILVSADFDQIVQVFRNLLENSIRHSPHGASIGIGSLIEGDMVRFSIKDEGPGIPKHYQERVFERFFRIERHRSDESGATGLGLAICRHIVQNHGGRIWVQSPNPGELSGSTFHFTLHKADTSDGTP